MNLIDLENRIFTKEAELKREIQNLKEFLSQNSKKKFKYFRKISCWIQFVFFLILIIIIYFAFLVDIVNIKGIGDLAALSIPALYILSWSYLFYSILTEHFFLNILYKYLNKGISEEKYLSEEKKIKKLQDKLSVYVRNIEAFLLNKNLYNEFLLNKTKLYEDESAFIKCKIDWEGKLDIRKKDYANTTFYKCVDFIEYETIKLKYWDQIINIFRYNFRLIESGLKELDNYFIKVENNLESGLPVFVNNTLSFNYLDQKTIHSFEEYLKYYTNNTDNTVI
ncbi:MAG: hypothetical protein IPL20_14325 [Saprospiraceae bacterium]|nr:hypothetical protein [Saprospiraceae bacterium]